jgi:autoinducer 2-binding protein LuxP
MVTTALLAATALAGTAGAQDALPLKELPGIEDRNYWVPEEVNADGKLEALQAVVGGEAVPFSGTQDAPIQIALIYPSSDTSDFWARNYLAMTKRLDELGITYETTEFASRQIEHSLQTTYANQVVQTLISMTT